MNTREKVLKEALNCVNGEREKQYGSPEDNFRRIADLWSVYLTSLFEDEKIVVDIDPIDVAKMMVLFKIARSNGDEDKLDNYIDILGYGACAAEIFESSEKTKKVLKKKEELGVQLADECKDCDYAEKCIGTGVCLKEEEEKRVENGEKILDNFADLVNARVRKKTEERLFNDIRALYGLDDDVRIAIVRSDSLDGSVVVTDEEKECKPDNKYDSYKAFNSISARISISSSKANVNPFDVVDRLARNNHTPTDMATLLMAGKLNFDDIVSYIDDVINELKKKEDKK